MFQFTNEMRLIWLLLTYVALASSASLKLSNHGKDSRLRYDDYQVFSLKIKNSTQFSIITLLSDLTQKYNIWKDYDEDSKEIHIMVNPKESKNFKQLLDMYGIKRKLIVENVQNLIDDESAIATVDDSATFGWKRYYQLEDIENWLDGILEAFPMVTESFIIGESYEGRTIRGIKISHKSGNPGIFIESNIHAREWITSASATWFINQLLTSNSAEIKNLAENYDWYIVPVFNVDGFVYSHKTDRMWRKTRQPVSTSNCIGVDANRNFPSHWMENNGASLNPCAQNYAGAEPWSEPETKALAQYVQSIQDNINIYFSFHSYGQYLLSPYGHTNESFPENYDDLLEMGVAFKSAIQSLSYGTEYTHGSTASTLYVASGTSVDYMFNEVGIKVGYTIEFRDKGRYGFVLPPVQILPTCEELMAGMVALIDKAKELKYV